MSKTKKSSTKAIKAKPSKSISSKDEKLLEKTLGLVHNLNSEIAKVQTAKNKLESDISRLSKKADKKGTDPKLEIELQKMKSQVNSNSNKTRKDLNLKILELEDKINKVLNSSNTLRKQVSNIDHQKISEDVFIEVEKKVNHTMQHSIDKLELQSKNIKHILAKYEKELRDREDEAGVEIEEKVKEILCAAQKTLKEVRKEEDKHSHFLVTKVNEVIDNVNGFEDYFGKLEKNSIKKIKNEVEESFTKVRNNVFQELKMKDRDYEKDLAKFKLDSSTHIKELVEKLNKEYSAFKNQIAAYEKDKFAFMEYAKKDKEAEREFIAKKYHEIMDQAEQTEKQIIELIHKNKNVIENKVNLGVEGAKESLKEEFAKMTISLNEALTRLNTEAKTKHRDLSEEIDSKLVSSTNQIDKKFKEILDRHELALVQKEKEYIHKLDAVEGERKKVLKDMNIFKTEMANLTKEYVTSMDEELKKIKLAESNFTKDQKSFEKDIDEILKEKKLELDATSKLAQDKVKDVLEEERKAFERHEETFRDVFNKKVQNLQEYDKNRLDKIEKKFVEKNLKYVTKDLDAKLEPIKLMSESIVAKEETLNKKMDEIEMREDALVADLHSHENQLKEKVEERIMGLEQNLNKRFLDLDSDFTNFKGVVVDEVEDLMKEVNELVNKKVEDADTMVSKLNFAGSEITKKISEFDAFYEGINDESKNLREELNDLRVKVEMGTSNIGVGSMNKLVSMMSDYEDNLVSLVSSLKQRDVSDSEISAALRDKGHPMMYVEMVLNSLNKMKH